MGEPVMVRVKTLCPAVIARTVVAAGVDEDAAVAAALGMGGPFQVEEETVRPTGQAVFVGKEVIGGGEVTGDTGGPGDAGGLSGGETEEGPETA